VIADGRRVVPGLRWLSRSVPTLSDPAGVFDAAVVE
jgi:hypothetical protein